MVLYVILFFVATCIGMAISVYAFGTGGKRKKIFEGIYFSVEDTDGIGVLYTKTSLPESSSRMRVARDMSSCLNPTSAISTEENIRTA